MIAARVPLSAVLQVLRAVPRSAIQVATTPAPAARPAMSCAAAPRPFIMKAMATAIIMPPHPGTGPGISMKAAGCTGLTPIMAGILAITAIAAGPMATAIAMAAATGIMAGDTAAGIGAGMEADIGAAADITTVVDGRMD